jgi:hypothetical protein
MAVKLSRAVPNKRQAIQSGAYLTDGTRLYRVLPDSCYGAVLLEDCARPGLYAQELTVSEVCSKMRLVRPEG